MDYVKSTLSKWEHANTKTPPVSYRVYLIVTALYEDGRQASRSDNHKSFKTVQDALKHTSERTEEMLKNLHRIGTDDI